MIKYLQRRYALSRKGAIDNIKGILCCAMQNISFMLPVGLLYRLVSDMMSGTLTTGRIPFYVIGCVAAALFIVVCTRLEYDNTYLVTYVESGVRRVGLAEKLRKIPLSFFGKKDLADLTTSIMNDCAVLEQSQSHFVAPLYGAILSTTVIAVSMLFFNWRMALAAVWPLPVAFAIVLLASDVQKKLSRKATAAKVACEDGIQECMEAMPDLRANNAEERYLSGLEKKIRAVESRLVRSELGTAVFVVSAGLVLRLGIATTALAGAALLVKGELDAAAVPANLAATLYQKTNGGIQAVAVNTLGVLYVVEQGDTVQSMADLKGRTILSTGKGTTPEYVLRYLLTKNGLDPDKDVKIEYYSEASEVTAQMAASKKDAIAVLPQPYVTAAQLKDSSLRVVLNLTKEWNKVCDTQLITGVTVVRTEYAKENPDIVANFLRDYEKSIKAAQTDVAGTAALCEETGVVAKKAIAQKALPQCNIVYRVGDEMKADVNAYLKVLYDASPAAVGGKLPDANFYYTKATPGQVFWRSVQRSFQ